MIQPSSENGVCRTCAANAIIVVDDKIHVHDHPLLLSYRKNRADEMWRLLGLSTMDRDGYECAICRGHSKGLGWYRCFHCNYAGHIKCVVYSDPPLSFKQVLLRDAKVPGLIHLPMANEYQSVIQRIMNSTIECASTSSYNSKVHKHPLVINHRNDDDDDDDDRVCNACVQLISPSDAFYMCSKVSCRDFFLHSCCEQLPESITTRKFNRKNEYHTLSLLVSGELVGKFPFNRLGGKFIFECTNLHNGFAYFCKVCREYMDVINALMPASITHDAHSKSHILRLVYKDDLICSCCKRDPKYFHMQIGYECNNCNNFFIHMDCALLPNKASHDFDRHPLNLITTNHHQEEEEVSFCEICEENMDNIGRWFYGCKKCDNSFHVDCIPYFDHLSRIKFGFTIQVWGHDCPLACVRALSVDGYRCGYCRVVIRESDEIAFECAECDYRFDKCCAERLLKD